MNRDYLCGNFEGSSFVWTQFRSQPILSVLGLPLLALDLILLPVRAIAWRKSSTSSYTGDCDSHEKQDKSRKGRKEGRKSGSKSGRDKEMREERGSKESPSKDKRRARRDRDGFPQSEQYHRPSYPSSGRHRRRRSGRENCQKEGDSNGHEIRHSKDDRLQAEGPHDASRSTLRNGPTQIPHQSIYGDEKHSQPLRGHESRSGPTPSGDAVNLPATPQDLPGAGGDEARLAGSMEQPSETPSTQGIPIPKSPSREKQSLSQRTSRGRQPSSRPSMSPATSSRSRTADPIADTNKTPPFSLPQQRPCPPPPTGQDREKMPHPRASTASPQNPSLSSAGDVHPPSSTQDAASKSTSQRRSDNSARSSSRSQSLHPPSSTPRRHGQQQGLMHPIPESRYDPEDEEPMVFQPMSAARRADIEGWKGDIVPGAPAPPSVVRGGRDDDYDGVESVGWWESYSQQMEESVGSERTGVGMGYSDRA